MTTIIEARNVTKLFGNGRLRSGGGTVGVADVSFTVDDEKPTITAVVGESGSGKTTLARLLLGLAAPTTGEVLYRGKDMRRLTRSERRRFLGDVQVVFQDPYDTYNPFYPVEHALQLTVRKFGLASSAAAARSLIDEAMSAVGLRPEATLGKRPHQLSGGQRQRLMVARALLLRPKLIVADEPVSMVDASMRASILTTIRGLHERYGISVVYITHDLTTAYQVSHQMMVLYKGDVVEAGDVESVIRDPQHPYTRLLIDSVPKPDPDEPWALERPSEKAARVTPTTCPFVDRCSRAMDACSQAKPPLFRTSSTRAVACFLYEDAHRLDRSELNTVLTGAR